MGGLLGGGGQRVCRPPPKLLGGGGGGCPPPLPTHMLGQKKFLYMKFLVLPWQLRKM